MDTQAAYPILVCAAAFLLGSIPFGLLVARLFQVKDLRAHGSGNIGATNVARVVGFWPAGALTLALDVLKGVIPVILAASYSLPLWQPLFEGVELRSSLHLSWLAGLFAVLGHCFSPWLHFRGGKGVATGLGVLLMLSPAAALIGIMGFLLAFLDQRIGSIASLSGLGVACVAHLVLNPMGSHLWAGAALIFVIVVRHESNISALLENRENRF